MSIAMLQTPDEISAFSMRHLPLDGGGWEGVRHALPALQAPLPNPPREGEGAGPAIVTHSRWRDWF